MQKWMAVAGLGLLLAGCARAEAPPQQAPAAQRAQPAVTSSTVQQALAASGVKITGPLDAPAGYHGFVGAYQGRNFPVYVGPDGKHILIGTLYDLRGRDLTSPAMQRAADAAFGEVQWNALATSTWFTTGNPKAKRVVYAFMDTECPYCHKLWLAAQQWISAGKVDLRIIPVAVISPKSLPKAARVLASADPAQAWRDNEAHFGQSGAPPPGTPADATVEKIRANNELMQQLGFFGTPGVIYKDGRGRIHTLHGLPRSAQELTAIFQDPD